MTVLIDADSLVYVIGWNYREGGTDDEVKRSCDAMLRDIVTLSQADDYIGVFSDNKCFRHNLYKYAPYKGNRGEKPDWVQRWEPVIKQYFKGKHGFIMIESLEADDVVAGVGAIMRSGLHDCIICSPDKDLKTVPGLLYAPKKQAEGGETLEGQILRITPEEADFNFWLQMLTGDSSDNVAGVPGLGEVKGKKLLNDCLDPMMYASTVQGAYVKYFGAYYGRIIFEETLHTLQLMQPTHKLWEEYRAKLFLIPGLRKAVSTAPSFFDI